MGLELDWQPMLLTIATLAAINLFSLLRLRNSRIGFQPGTVRAIERGRDRSHGFAILQRWLDQPVHLAVPAAAGDRRRDPAAALHMGHGRADHALLYLPDETLCAFAHVARTIRCREWHP